MNYNVKAVIRNFFQIGGKVAIAAQDLHRSNVVQVARELSYSARFAAVDKHYRVVVDSDVMAKRFFEMLDNHAKDERGQRALDRITVLTPDQLIGMHPDALIELIVITDEQTQFPYSMIWRAEHALLLSGNKKLNVTLERMGDILMDVVSVRSGPAPSRCKSNPAEVIEGKRFLPPTEYLQRILAVQSAAEGIGEPLKLDLAFPAATD